MPTGKLFPGLCDEVVVTFSEASMASGSVHDIGISDVPNSTITVILDGQLRTRGALVSTKQKQKKKTGLTYHHLIENGFKKMC